MPVFEESFIASLAATGADLPGYRWFLPALVSVGSMNYPEEIPAMFTYLLANTPKEKHDETILHLREAFTKMAGISGACRTGNAIRALSTATPSSYKDDTLYRAHDTDEITHARGQAMHKKIYARNPLFDPKKTEAASADYTYVIRELFYGKIFSFDGILDYRESAHVIIAALIGMDCQVQVRNHMIGMRLNGVDVRELQATRAIAIAMAEKLGVRFKQLPIEVPEIPEQK